jgi:hypothetical protein
MSEVNKRTSPHEGLGFLRCPSPQWRGAAKAAGRGGVRSLRANERRVQ